MRRTTALIAGGGPAGAAAAIRLAQGGVAATVIERSTATAETVCGGFLGCDGAAALETLGVPPWAIDARPIARLRLSDGATSTDLRLPFRAFGISRAVMDQALLDRAVAVGAEVVRGQSVRSVAGERVSVHPHPSHDLRSRAPSLSHREREGGAQRRKGEGDAINADAIFIATGKHNLRGVDRPKAEWAGAGVGIRWTIAATPALTASLDGVIELIAFRSGYAGLLLRGDGTANLCLSIAQTRMVAAGGIDALMAELADEQPIFARYLALESVGPRATVAAVPYGWRARSGKPGQFRIGDQGAVIASVVGDGMAIALNSGIWAGDAMLGGGADAGAAFQRDLARRARLPLGVAERLRWGAEHAGPRRAVLAAARVVPALIGLAARATRIA